MTAQNNMSNSAEALVAEMQAYYQRRAPVYDASMRYDKPEVGASLEPTRVMFARADAYDLSALDSPIEGWTGCFAVDWLAHVPRSRMQEFLHSVNDRMLPGARVSFCDQMPRAASMSGVYDAEGNHLQERNLPDGSRYRVNKYFFADRDYQQILATGGTQISIQRFPEQRRVVASYTALPSVFAR